MLQRNSAPSEGAKSAAERLHTMPKVASATDKGWVKSNNEDAVFAVETPERADFKALLVVADGIGGHPAGEVASGMVVDTFSESLEEIGAFPHSGHGHALASIISRANRLIRKAADEDRYKYGMGSTVVATTISDGSMSVAWAGDSRAYLIRHGTAWQITDDHSVVNELVKSGAITPEQAETHPLSNHITRAAGIHETVHSDTIDIDIMEGDIVLLCSDGLSRYVSNAEIAEIAASASGPGEFCRNLIGLANSRGGRDNITAAAAFIGRSLKT